MAYRVEELNYIMDDHYSSVTLAQFEDLISRPEREDDNPRMWSETLKEELKSVSKMKDQPCYEALCDVFNEVMTDAKLPYVIENTSTNSRKDDRLATPDLCLYPIDDYAKQAYTDAKSGYHDSRIPEATADRVDSGLTDGIAKKHAAVPRNKALTAWAWIVLFFEIKMGPGWEPFANKKNGKLKLKGTKHGAETRAQNINCAMRVQRYQHRRFVFSVSIQGAKARFVRWDRNGVVVSHEFDYTQDPGKLLDFVFIVAADTRSRQGHDDSVRRLTADEAKALEKVVAAKYKPCSGSDPAANASLKEASREIFADLLRHPVYEVSCSGLEPDTSRGYYIGKYRASSRSPVGRGTRVYVAYDPECNEIVMLKDSWCVVGSDPSVLNEFEVLKDFLRAGGFIDGATTVSQEFIERDTGVAHMIRQNMRFVVKEVGRSIDTFKTSRELVQVVYSAFKGHRGAYEMENGVLHRDVSYTNILIDVATGEGFMNDWDMCKRVADLGSGPLENLRMGTWYYMAAILQQHPRMHNVLPHDLESFVYVLVVLVLQFQRYNLMESLPGYFTSTFDGACQTDEGMQGGMVKAIHIELGHPGWELRADESPLATLISDLYRLLQSQWASFSKPERRAMTAHWGTIDKKDPKPLKPEDYPIPDLIASRPMATHDSMDKIFKDALASEGWDDERLKKTEAQFIGLFADRPVFLQQVDTSAMQLKTLKRTHESDDEDD